MKTFVKKKTLINIKVKRKSKDELITATAERLNRKIELGINLINIPFIETREIFDMLIYIFKKPIRTQNDNLIIRHYLSNFPGLISTLNLKKNFSDPQELLIKLCLFIQCEYHPKDSIVCLNGQIGDNFYLIFKGLVIVLVPIEYKMFLKQEEFIYYLKNLEKNNEYDLLNRSILSNKKIINEKYKNIISDFEKKTTLTSNLTNFKKEIIDWENYIERLIPRNVNKNSDSIEFTLWKYHNVCDLESGKSFGDIALKDDTKRRTATIITLKESYLGTLRKDIYKNCIKDALDKIRRNNIECIISTKLFDNYNSDNFEFNYFNYFKKMNLSKGSFLVKKGEERKEIYFIKSGELKAEINCNNDYLDGIIENLGGDSYNKFLIDLIQQNYKMIEFNKEVKNFSLFFIRSGDVIGLDDYITLDMNFFANIKCSSASVELFSINIEFFNKMLKERKIFNNYIQWVEDRKKVMVDRLLELKKNTLLHYYSFVKDKSYDNWKNFNSRNNTIEIVPNKLFRNTITSFPNIKNKESLFFKNKFHKFKNDKNKNNNFNIYNDEKDKKNFEKRTLSETHTLVSSDYQSEKKKNRKSIFQNSILNSNNILTDYNNNNNNIKKTNYKVKFGNFPINKYLTPRKKLYNNVIDKLIKEHKNFCKNENNIYNNTLKSFDMLTFDKYIEENKNEKLFLRKSNHIRFYSKYYDILNSDKFIPKIFEYKFSKKKIKNKRYSSVDINNNNNTKIKI